MHTINPVQVVSDFLKSGEGEAMMTVLAETGRQIEIGVVDGMTIALEKDGFKVVRKNGDKERATAYDVFDCFMAGRAEPLTTEDAIMSFRSFVIHRMERALS